MKNTNTDNTTDTNFDRFDICEAFYLFATHYHTGQGSSTYAIFGRLARLGFSPSPLLSLDTLNENASAIYANLAADEVS